MKKSIKNSGLSSRLMKRVVQTTLDNTDASRIILYGSRARGDYKETSDIDLAIISSRSAHALKEILNEEIPTLLKFDVINFSKAENALKREILKEGIVLYEKSRATL